MVTIQEAKQQVKEARERISQTKQQVSQQQQKAGEVLSKLSQAKSKLPDVRRPRYVRSLPREKRRQIYRTGQTISKNIQQVEQARQQLAEHTQKIKEQEQEIQQYEQKIQKVEAVQRAQAKLKEDYEMGRKAALEGESSVYLANKRQKKFYRMFKENLNALEEYKKMSDAILKETGLPTYKFKELSSEELSKLPESSLKELEKVGAIKIEPPPLEGYIAYDKSGRPIQSVASIPELIDFSNIPTIDTSKMDRGDKLRVQINEFNKIKRDSEKTFFDFFKMGGIPSVSAQEIYSTKQPPKIEKSLVKDNIFTRGTTISTDVKGFFEQKLKEAKPKQYPLMVSKAPNLFGRFKKSIEEKGFARTIVDFPLEEIGRIVRIHELKQERPYQPYATERAISQVPKFLSYVTPLGTLVFASDVVGAVENLFTKKGRERLNLESTELKVSGKGDIESKYLPYVEEGAILGLGIVGAKSFLSNLRELKQFESLAKAEPKLTIGVEYAGEDLSRIKLASRQKGKGIELETIQKLNVQKVGDKQYQITKGKVFQTLKQDSLLFSPNKVSKRAYTYYGKASDTAGRLVKETKLGKIKKEFIKGDVPVITNVKLLEVAQPEKQSLIERIFFSPEEVVVMPKGKQFKSIGGGVFRTKQLGNVEGTVIDLDTGLIKESGKFTLGISGLKKGISNEGMVKVIKVKPKEVSLVKTIEEKPKFEVYVPQKENFDLNFIKPIKNRIIDIKPSEEIKKISTKETILDLDTGGTLKIKSTKQAKEIGTGVLTGQQVEQELIQRAKPKEVSLVKHFEVFPLVSAKTVTSNVIKDKSILKQPLIKKETTKPIQFETLEYKPKELEKTKTKLSYKPLQVEKTKTKLKQMTKPKQKSIQLEKLSQVPKERVKVRELLNIRTKQAQRLKIRTKQAQRLKQKMKQSLVSRTTTTKTSTQSKPKPKNIITPDLKEAKPKETPKKQKITKDMFKVFVKKFGKDIKLGEFETLESAKKKLKKELLGTLRASGFVKKGEKKIKLNLGFGFRPSKKDIFRVVQRKTARFGTRGETSEAQFFRKTKGRKIKFI